MPCLSPCSRLRQHLLAGRAEHQPPAERIAVEQPAEEATGAPPSRSPAAGHAPRRGERDVPEDGVRHQLVDDADPECLLSPLDLPSQDHIERRPRPDEARQALATARSREDPELHLR